MYYRPHQNEHRIAGSVHEMLHYDLHIWGNGWIIPSKLFKLGCIFEVIPLNSSCNIIYGTTFSCNTNLVYFEVALRLFYSIFPSKLSVRVLRQNTSMFLPIGFYAKSLITFERFSIVGVQHAQYEPAPSKFSNTLTYKPVLCNNFMYCRRYRANYY